MEDKYKELYRYKANLNSIYDGDSVRLDIDLGFGSWLINQRIRLYGIDAPEIRGEERDAGLEAKAFLWQELIDQELVIESYKDRSDKYGRWLATIYVEASDQDDNIIWVNVNELMVSSGHATPYPK